MCGIVGFVGDAMPDVEAHEVLSRMLDCIAYRGPDDFGTYAAPGVAIGHVRLSIIDLSKRGHQPFLTIDGLGVLAYNGEVYNFRELRRELEREGVVFRSDTDTEVVLYALHHWGPTRAISRFNGMFAFAYYDRRDGSLWLARDRMGIKPLYVAKSGETLVFASEQKALFAHPRIGCVPDIHAVMTLLLFERFEGTMTPYRNVAALAPGRLHRIRQGNETSETYFDVLRDIDPKRMLDEGGGFDVAFATFEELFTDSVRMHLVSDAPLAAMCSGGLDSSLVTAAVRDVKADIVSYVADVEGMGQEEVRRAKIVCDALGVELRCIRVDSETYFRTLPIAILANDQPLYFSQDVAAMVVAESMHADGFKVVLTGDGADEVFGGYDWHAEAYRTWRRRRLRARWIGDNVVTRLLGRYIPALRPIDLGALAETPFADITASEGGVNPRNVLLADGARRHLREARLFRKLEALPLYEDRAFLAKSFEDIYVHLRERLGTVDRMAMRYSIEARVPFLENRLIDFGLHLPLFAKYHRRVTKRLIKTLAEKRLPSQIVHLPKIGFRVDPGMWRGTLELLRNGRVAELLKWSTDDQQDIFHLLRTHRYYQFRLLAMELWLRLRFGGESPEKLSELLLALKRRTAAASA